MLSGVGMFLLAPLGAFCLGNKLIRTYRLRGKLKANYRGLQAAPALGPALLLAFMGGVAVAVWSGEDPRFWLVNGFLIVAAGFFGLWDDLMDDRTSGFAGHLGAALSGEMTAGLLKIITAVLAVFIVTGSLDISLAQRLLAMLVILLSANGLNLLDRRPGRTVKGFFAGAVIIIFLAYPDPAAARLLLPLMGSALVLAPLDLRAEAMLGDCGSNLLGAALGMASVFFLSLPVQVALVAFWLTLHFIAEGSSFSVIIEQNSFLSYLDRLGRSGEKFPE